MSQPIVIVGGGPVGATLALFLARRGIKSRVYEARSAGAAHQDTRALALSYGSRHLFERVGVWRDIAPHTTVINTVHISQKGGLGRSLLKAQEHGLEALGYVVSYGAVSKALDAAIAASDAVAMINDATVQSIQQVENESIVNVSHQNKVQEIPTALAVIADGGRSVNELTDIKRNIKPYGHDALVTKVAAELPHNNIAYERFTPTGPAALLPNGERDFSLVWTGESEIITSILALSDEDFLNAFHVHFGDRLGQFTHVGKRLSFPLMMAQAELRAKLHLVVIGNAAQTMHPVAGQGFNVGLRDAEALAKGLMSTPEGEWGKQAMMDTYAAARKRDAKRGLLFTDFLVNVFSNDVIGLSSLRSAGLVLLDSVKPIKNLLVRKMSHGK
jgi:2-octaprenyl-6-methoxyphenol hydroxylase